MWVYKLITHEYADWHEHHHQQKHHNDAKDDVEDPVLADLEERHDDDVDDEADGDDRQIAQDVALGVDIVGSHQNDEAKAEAEIPNEISCNNKTIGKQVSEIMLVALLQGGPKKNAHFMEMSSCI